MRWVPFLLAVYAIMLLQTSLGRLLTFSTDFAGQIGPDLAAVLAVFLALHARAAVDALAGAWVLGFSIDLLAAGAVEGGACAGMMSLSYMAGAGAVFWVREAFFRDRPLTQAILSVVFCLLAHGLWITGQAARAGDWASWRRMIPQMLALTAYTAVLAPLCNVLLLRMRRLFLVSAGGEVHPRHGRW
ncbi:MAG: hypothetical protein NT031_10245 [Planctomycetota bacterium]|nr:hypothetical protein [Planctomycetota bacterium]